MGSAMMVSSSAVSGCGSCHGLIEGEERQRRGWAYIKLDDRSELENIILQFFLV
jgi:hypothetical protein